MAPLCCVLQCTSKRTFLRHGVFQRAFSSHNSNHPSTSNADSFTSASTTTSKKYILSMFPYPSGRLHMGHLRVYTLSDVLSRYYALKGHRVIHPIGWDAFGLPAENAARDHGVDPAEWTYKNIEEMRSQLTRTGVQFDWDRELFTCRPDYFRWSQWIFLQLYRHGLVRKTISEVNWDPVDATVLADEQVDASGCSWRSGARVEKRKLRQWAVDTPRYAKRLLDGLGPLEFDWRGVADIQADWIGPCDVYRFLLPILQPSGEGEQLDLRLSDPTELCNAQFVMIGTEHSITKQAKFALDKEPFAILDNFTVSDFVTGRPLPVVVTKDDKNPNFALNARIGHSLSEDPIDQAISKRLGLTAPRTEGGARMDADEVLRLAKAQNAGGYQTSRTLRDWVVSRQREWGTPIPMLLEEGGGEGVEPVPEDQLPVLGTHRGQRRRAQSFASGWGQVETDTLDTYFDSSWYFLRFLDPHNDQFPFDKQIVARDMPVDIYVGGMEHAKMHLFYARFISHFLYSLDLVPQPEPFARFIPLGVVKAPTYRLADSGKYVPETEVDGDKLSPQAKCVQKTTGKPVKKEFEKMSKSKHNGVDPLAVIDEYGTDLARLQLLFEARPSQPINWPYPYPTYQLKSLRRWVAKVQSVVDAYMARNPGQNTLNADESMDAVCNRLFNHYVKQISVFLEVLRFHNMALIRLQDFTKALNKLQQQDSEHARTPAFARCVHAMVVMAQIFAPELAATHWTTLQQQKAETQLPISTADQWHWDLGAPITAQRWPVADQQDNVEILLLVYGTVCSGKASLAEVASMDNAQLEQFAREKCHRRFFELLAKNKVQIEHSNIERFPGLCIAMNLELSGNVRKRTITSIIQELSKERKKEQGERDGTPNEDEGEEEQFMTG